MVLKNDGEPIGEIHIEGKQLNKVEKFKYLGSVISSEGLVEDEVSNRIWSAGNFYNVIKDLVWNEYVPLKCKKTIYQTYYPPILTYSSETWMQTAEMRFVRTMCGKTRKDWIRNENLREMVQIERSRLKWYGHVKRMDGARLPRQGLRKHTMTTGTEEDHEEDTKI